MVPVRDYFELEAAARPVAVSGAVAAFGFHWVGPGDNTKVRNGSVTALPIKRDVQWVEVSQELTQGMSGGPIFDARNGAIGIVNKGGPEERRQFAIAIGVLQQGVAE